MVAESEPQPEPESGPSASPAPPVVLPNLFVHRHNMGKGLVAKNAIKAGTQILIEKAIFVAPASFYFEPCTRAAERNVKKHVESLNSTDRAAWEIISNYHPFAKYLKDGLSTGKFIKTHYVGKFKTAGIPIPLGPRRLKAGHFGVFPLLSWANHSCHHNAHHAWNESLKAMTVYALNDIAADEQITISYAPANVINRDLIKRLYGFTCYCDWCMLRPEDRQASDEKHHKVEDWSMRVHREKDKGKALWIVHCAFEIMLEEPIKDYRLGMLFADAYDIALTLGDYVRAPIFGFMACQAFAYCEGNMSDAAGRVRKALGELMRKVEGLDAGKAVEQGVGGKGEGKEGVDDAKNEKDSLPEGFKDWLLQRQSVWYEKREAEGDEAFKWLFMSELWPKTD